MSKVYAGTTTNNVTELTLQEEGVGNIGTQTIVWDSTQGTIDQVIGAIPDNWKNGDGSLKQLQIGSSCTSIGSRAFYYCNGFDGSLTIGNSVTSIGDYAFNFCSGLTGSLTIGNSVTSIGSYAFGEVGFTGSLTIPDSVTSIGDFAFWLCLSITSVSILATTAPTFGSNAFASMTSVSPAVIHVPVGATGYAASYDGLTVVYDL